MIEPSPVRHHMTRRHDPVRLCDGQPADDDDIPATDIDALRDARAEATLCPVCQQNSHIHDYSLRPDRYHDGRRTLAHLYTVPHGDMVARYTRGEVAGEALKWLT